MLVPLAYPPNLNFLGQTVSEIWLVEAKQNGRRTVKRPVRRPISPEPLVLSGWGFRGDVGLHLLRRPEEVLGLEIFGAPICSKPIGIGNTVCGAPNGGFPGSLGPPVSELAAAEGGTQISEKWADWATPPFGTLGARSLGFGRSGGVK